MTNLPIHITTHHLTLSESLRLIACKKIAPVVRFANDALAAEIVLRRHGGAITRFSASARLALPGQDVHGKAVDQNLYVAIGKLVSKLGRLLRKRKTRLAKSFARTGARRSIEVPEQLPLSLPESLVEPAAKRPRAREGGQEMRVFPFRRHSPFTLRPNHGVESPTEAD